MTIIYTGKSVPLNGKRKLSGREAQQRAKALKCLTTPGTSCSGQVHIGLFFDGTGNNKDWAEPQFSGNQLARNKHSNVARLWQAHLEDKPNGIFKVYMQGVGTPFADLGDTRETLTKIAGNAFAYMGADRINWGIISILQLLNQYITGAALMSKETQRALVNQISIGILSGVEPAMRWSSLTALEEKVARTAKKSQRKIQQINISIFGFSRGAAEARTCCHWLNQICEREGGGLALAGIPLRIGFLGIFDTVAAVGVGDVTPITFGHMAWADGTQNIHPSVEECAHFIALHEQRASFPLESATGRGNIGYPGMHSDVGGGYCPGEQGKSMPAWGESPHLSQIPLLDMHFAAIKAGVPLTTIDEIAADKNLAKSFSTDPKLIASYNAWLASNGIKAGNVTQFTEEHTKQYIRWRGTLHEHGVSSLHSKRFYRDSASDDKKRLDLVNDKLGERLLSWKYRKKANSTVLGYTRERLKDIQSILVQRNLFDVMDRAPLSSDEAKFLHLFTEAPKPPKACVELFEEYVHDSRAGFEIMDGVPEPQFLTGGYGRFRHVFLQKNSESQIANIANESLKSVKAAADEAEAYFQWLYNASLDTYHAARAKIYRTARQVRDKAVDTAHKVEDAAIRGAHAVHDEAITVGNHIKDGVASAAHKTREVATEAEHGLEKGAAAAQQSAMRAADEAARIYNAAQKKVVMDWHMAEQRWHELFEKKKEAAKSAATAN